MHVALIVDRSRLRLEHEMLAHLTGALSERVEVRAGRKAGVGNAVWPIQYHASRTFEIMAGVFMSG